MFDEPKNADSSQTGLETVCQLSADLNALPQITEKLLRVMAELASNGEQGLPLHLESGELLCQVKKKKKRGEFGSYCKNVLDRSPSFCSSRMRLYKSKEDLEPAREWAKGKRHRYKDCQSPERLLILLADWRRDMKGGEGAHLTQDKPKANRIGDLKKQLEENEREFVALRDLLDAEDIAEAKRLAPLDDETSKAALGALARQRHWRVRDLIASALQVSDPVTAAEMGDA